MHETLKKFEWTWFCWTVDNLRYYRARFFHVSQTIAHNTLLKPSPCRLFQLFLFFSSLLPLRKEIRLHVMSIIDSSIRLLKVIITVWLNLFSHSFQVLFACFHTTKYFIFNVCLNFFFGGKMLNAVWCYSFIFHHHLYVSNVYFSLHLI